VTPVAIVLAVAAVAVGAAASLLRQSGVPATDTIWAEDGQVFFGDMFRLSFGEALVTPYNGYFQFIPRLLLAPVPLFPASMAAAVIAVEAALVNSAFALLVYVASGPTLRTVPLRLVASAVAVLPTLGLAEVPNSIANVHWAGLYALFWVLFWVPASRAGRVVGLVVAFAVSFTNILVAVFLPLLLARAAVRRREAHSLALGGIVLAGLGTHAAGLLFGNSSRVGGVQSSFAEPLDTFFRWVVPSFMLGDGPLDTDAFGLNGQRNLLILGWLLVAAFVAVGVLRRRDANWPLAVVAAAHSIVLWVGAAGTSGQMASRYVATAAMFFTAALAALLVPSGAVEEGETSGRLAARAWSRRLATPAAWGLIAVYLVALVQTIPTESARSAGPGWSASVAEARAACARSGGRGDDGAGTIRLPITPNNWGIRLPCSYVDG
jgi:hypothetical protein